MAWLPTPGGRRRAWPSPCRQRGFREKIAFPSDSALVGGSLQAGDSMWALVCQSPEKVGGGVKKRRDRKRKKAGGKKGGNGGNYIVLQI